MSCGGRCSCYEDDGYLSRQQGASPGKIEKEATCP